jgi:hypothetical protein
MNMPTKVKIPGMLSRPIEIAKTWLMSGSESIALVTMTGEKLYKA